MPLAGSFGLTGSLKTHAASAQLTLSELPQLTIQLLNEKYCQADSELDSLQIDLTLTFSNNGQDRIILYKGSNRIIRIMISHNLDDAKAKRFEVNSSLTMVDEGHVLKIDGPVPNEMFTVLTPSAKYEVKTSLTIFVRKDKNNAISGTIGPGEHTLQIEVQTFPPSDYSPSELRRKWQPIGVLCYEPILSGPVPFHVDIQRKVSDCK